MKQSAHGKSLTVSILSLSLLTVMAGAAVAPALGVIQAHFSSSNQLFIQMIISVPALFIVITNFIFPRLCRVFGAKTLVMIGLLLYTVGGCAAGLFDNIFVVLIMRAFVGIGVGIAAVNRTAFLLLQSGRAGRIDGIFFRHEPDERSRCHIIIRTACKYQLACQLPGISDGVDQYCALPDLSAK